MGITSETTAILAREQELQNDQSELTEGEDATIPTPPSPAEMANEGATSAAQATAPPLADDTTTSATPAAAADVQTPAAPSMTADDTTTAQIAETPTPVAHAPEPFVQAK